jgi:hypothetical protein
MDRKPLPILDTYLKCLKVVPGLRLFPSCLQSFARVVSRCKCFVFVATTGRSGTTTLVRQLGSVSGVLAEHEAPPILNERFLRSAGNGDPFPVLDAWPLKAAAIRLGSLRARVYVDSSHLFLKSYLGEAIREFRRELRIIHLKRDPIDTAASLSVLTSAPGTTAGHDWYLHPDDSTNLLRVGDLFSAGQEFDGPFYRGLWYWYETELRIESAKRTYSSVPWLEVKTESLSRRSELFRILDWLNLEHDRVSIEIDFARKHNSKPAERQERSVYESRKESFLQACLERGYDLSRF